MQTIFKFHFCSTSSDSIGTLPWNRDAYVSSVTEFFPEIRGEKEVICLPKSTLFFLGRLLGKHKIFRLCDVSKFSHHFPSIFLEHFVARTCVNKNWIWRTSDKLGRESSQKSVAEFRNSEFYFSDVQLVFLKGWHCLSSLLRDLFLILRILFSSISTCNFAEDYNKCTLLKINQSESNW